MKFMDNYGNSVTIEKVMTLPYKGAKSKQEGFILKLFADYDNGFNYHVSMYESLEEAKQKLSKFSCGSFKITIN